MLSVIGDTIGHRIRIVAHLARRHQITYLSFADTATDSSKLAGMCQVAERVITLARYERPKGSLRFYVDVAAHLADSLPYAVATYRSTAFRARILRLLEQTPFHLVVCDFLAQAVNLPPALPCASVLFTHNVESEIWRRHAETNQGRMTHGLYDAQYRRMLAALLQDRFKLGIRQQEKQAAVYILTLAKGGSARPSAAIC